MKKIAFIAQPEYYRFIYENCLDGLFTVREFPFKFNMGPKDFDDLLSYDADYNIFFRGEYFPETVLKQLKGVKVALSSEPFPRRINGRWEFTYDSVKRYFEFRRIRYKSFDYLFHYDAASLPLFEADGLQISGEFVFPVARDVYRKRQLEKKWDIFFIGKSTPHRENYLISLKHHYHFLHIAHGIWGSELVDYINQSKICLNIHAAKEVSWEPRMQILLSSGAFVISEKITPNKYLTPGKDFIEIKNNIDLQNNVEYYLSNEYKRKKIVNHAEQTINKYFHARLKIEILIDNIDNNILNRFRPINKGNSVITFFEKINLLSYRLFSR